MSRRRSGIDDLVIEIIAEFLSRGDVKERLTALMGAENSAEVKELREKISAQNGRLARAKADYDQEFIEGADLKRIRDAVTTEVGALEVRLATLTSKTNLGPVINTADPAGTFLAANIEIQRVAIDALCKISLLRQPPGHRRFNPESVTFEWKV